MTKLLTNPVNRNKLKQSLLYGSLSSCFTACCLLSDDLGFLNKQYDVKSLQLDIEIKSHALTNQELVETQEELKNIKDLLNVYKGLTQQLRTQRDRYIKQVKELTASLKVKERSIADLTRQLEIMKATNASLLEDLKSQTEELNSAHSLIEALKDFLKQNDAEIDRLRQEIKNLDDNVQELFDEITKTREQLTTLRKQHGEAVKAVFEINNINKELNKVVRELLQTKEALLSYLHHYEKNSVTLKQDSCIYQTLADGNVPYKECIGDFLANAHKFVATVKLLPVNTDDQSDPTYQYLKKGTEQK